MFRIGEFAQIAQVSGRQLRHWDQLGLLVPGHIDPATGYRYYAIRQLSRLNRILALKELGLTLEQIGPMLEGQVSAQELRGMLAMKRAQVEQTLAAEEARLRHIESRIAQLDADGALADCDVVMKSAPAQPYLALRALVDGMDEAFALVASVVAGGARIRPALRDQLTVVVGPDREDERLELDVGFTLTRPTNQTVRIAGDQVLAMRELPAAPALATLVRCGPGYEAHRDFGALGGWIEANGYVVEGPRREVILEPAARFEDTLIELQFPVRKTA